jgi:hypothetical protein
MEDVQASLKASKVTIVTSSYFSDQAKNYAIRKNIKLVDRNNLLELARKYQDRTNQTTLDNTPYDGGASAYIEEEYPEYNYDASDMEYLMRRRDAHPNVYKNTLYRQVDEPRAGGLSSILNRGRQQKTTGSLSPYSRQTDLYNYDSRPSSYGVSSMGIGALFFRIVSNPIGLVLVVVVVSYLLSFIAGNLLKMDSGITGLIEMFVALALSYGLSFYTDRNADFIVKGTFIFFISLIILIILIFV